MSATHNGVPVRRRFTSKGTHPFDQIAWETRDAVIGDPAKPAFRQNGVEVPKHWSQNATNIVASKYFRGPLGSPERESSVKQIVSRVAHTITDWGMEGNYFSSREDAAIFEMELTHILVNQMAAFNSPVWFNVGFEENPQCSACFILGVDDTMESLLEWNTKEGVIFRGGSGSGVSLSKIRGSMEQLSKGGTASGPVTFMRGTDSWAGTIKSGGKTRRAAKMVCLDVDHPDIEEFIWCKAKEERKAAILAEAGYSLGMEGEVLQSIQYQNANNSVRLTDEFMHLATRGGDWVLTARKDGSPIKRVDAKDLLNQIAQAAWECADPGVQFDTTINAWHTSPGSGRINASNPCSEYMHIDDSACNLASLNLMAFRVAPGVFDVEAFEHCVDVMFMAQDILIDKSSYPTEEIGRNARTHRQLGLGYANLGALLMAEGLPYDSVEGRDLAAAITAIMTGRAYRQSAIMARDMGVYEAFENERNADAHHKVIAMHCDAALNLRDKAMSNELAQRLADDAVDNWMEAQHLGVEYGYRNAQATVLAPTGTISFLMDCDTTGVEPDFALVKYKDLVGGGQMEIINRIVPVALDALGYGPAVATEVTAWIKEHGSVDGCPAVKASDLAVFDTANTISPKGHVRMMGAVQPFISGAISKTVNMPNDATVEEIEDLIVFAWKEGVKALAIYRDGSKQQQALSTKKKSTTPVVKEDAQEQAPVRQRLPHTRSSITHKFVINGHEGYITAGMFDDGTLGEVFVNVGKEGSTVAGMLDFSATLLSLALQYGVPLEDLARKFRDMKFEPNGRTENPEIMATSSIPDYIMRWLVSKFGDTDLQEELGVMTDAVKQRKMDQFAVHQEHNVDEGPMSKTQSDYGPPCTSCGSLTQRTGACFTCNSCGTTTGCG